ncbi:hypothetical protein E2C01_063343 [Portunus trituberculatus]|uniref:Uncharacterized protein n=1 Tax=Portunus trituberculatus TaxID=210409 RepID=A0A5B7HHB8_PORTR|nr:hypothetical protein [Portunus trituberculatus]
MITQDAAAKFIPLRFGIDFSQQASGRGSGWGGAGWSRGGEGGAPSHRYREQVSTLRDSVLASGRRAPDESTPASYSTLDVRSFGGDFSMSEAAGGSGREGTGKARSGAAEVDCRTPMW